MAMFTFCLVTVLICTLCQLTCISGGLAADVIHCPPGNTFCENDRMGFEAIQKLHTQIDDDQDGSLDRTESDEFFRDELHHGNWDAQANSFHGADDKISVKDLWVLWTHSAVYNWTVDECIDWLVNQVELPQYADSFRINAVDGHTLPRLAINGQYLTNILGIKNVVHKQKLSLKAMDVVLFGPPKAYNYVKDLALGLSVLVLFVVMWLARAQNNSAQRHLKKVMEDLDNLQQAEDALHSLQTRLEEAQKEQRSVAEEKQNLERKMQDEIRTAKEEAERIKVTRESTEEEMSRLKLAEAELVQVRKALQRTERELEERLSAAAPLEELQQWLQLTYELENLHYETKKEIAVKQLMQAKEMCERIRKKRGAFLGSLRVAHSMAIDDTDNSILGARAALEEVKIQLQERCNRWKTIEKICGFNIILNPGLQYLESLLKTGYIHAGGLAHSASTLALGQLGHPLTVEDGDEDHPPGAHSNTAAFYGSHMTLNSPISDTRMKDINCFAGTVSGMKSKTYSVPVGLSLLQHPIPSKRKCPNGTTATTAPSLVRCATTSTEMGNIWAGLAQAGMQFAMPGVTAKPLKGLHAPMMVSGTRGPSIASALGSSASLSQPRHKQMGPVTNLTYHQSDTETDNDDSLGSPVSFDLGHGHGAESGTAHLDDSFGALDHMPRSINTSLTKATSLEGSRLSHVHARPKTLPQSLSEPAPSVTHGASINKVIQRKHTPPSAVMASNDGTSPISSHAGDDSSSQEESTDSMSVTDDGSKKKKKKKLFSKLLKVSSDKHKST